MYNRIHFFITLCIFRNEIKIFTFLSYLSLSLLKKYLEHLLNTKIIFKTIATVLKNTIKKKTLVIF